jgi:hypothetical protein
VVLWLFQVVRGGIWLMLILGHIRDNTQTVMLPRDLVSVRNQAACDLLLLMFGQNCSALHALKELVFFYPVFIELISILPKRQSDIGDLPR